MTLKQRRVVLVQVCCREFSVGGQTRIIPIQPEDRMLHILPAKVFYNQ